MRSWISRGRVRRGDFGGGDVVGLEGGEDGILVRDIEEVIKRSLRFVQKKACLGRQVSIDCGADICTWYVLLLPMLTWAKKRHVHESGSELKHVPSMIAGSKSKHLQCVFNGCLSEIINTSGRGHM